MVKTQTEIQKDYDERRKAEGLVRVTVWVPKGRKADLVAIAAYMRLDRDADT